MVYKLIFRSYCPSFQLIPAQLSQLFIPSLAHSVQAFLLCPISACPIILAPPAPFPFPSLFPSLVSCEVKLINLDDFLGHNNLKVLELFVSLQSASRTTTANFETIALSRQTVLPHIISLEAFSAASLQSQIHLPFFLPPPFFLLYYFFNNQHIGSLRTQ